MPGEAMSIIRAFLDALGFGAARPAQARREGPPPDVREAAEWLAMALRSSGYKADFSLESLREVDRFFDNHAPDGKVRPGGLLAERQGERIFAIGAYIGEVIRVRRGGTWHFNRAIPQAEWHMELRLDTGSTIRPMERAMKRFKNGPEDGIYVYGLFVATGITRDG